MGAVQEAAATAQSRGWSPRALARGAVATIDLDALRHNVRVMRDRVGTDVMAVVKADAYGHGLVPCALAAREAGATWLGVALPDEAIALREAGVDGRILTWLLVPDSPVEACIAHEIDITVSAPWALDLVRESARRSGVVARVQLKLDSGLSRNGCTIDEWPALIAGARAAELEGLVSVTGVWTHLASADEPGLPGVADQLALFHHALGLAEVAGLRPGLRHAANSAGALVVPEARLDLVRVGIALYGISPIEEVGAVDDLGLRPVMSLRALLASVKQVPAGSGVSYGSSYVTSAATTLALVPLGYADGISRAASGAGPLVVAGRRRTIAGRVCMDQFVVDLHGDDAQPGDEVVLFGPDGPSADDWAAVCGTIGYEIVTRVGPRVPREYLGVTS